MSAAPGVHKVLTQAWGPDELTVEAVGAIDTVWGLSLAGQGNDSALREGLSGMNEGGTSFGGELGPLQAFAGPSQGTIEALRVGAGGGLPGSTGVGSSGPVGIQAMFADEPV